MKAEELKKLKEMSMEDLAKKEQELKEELFNLRFQQATGPLRNPLRIRECKRDIARVKTVVCERRLDA